MKKIPFVCLVVRLAVSHPEYHQCGRLGLNIFNLYLMLPVGIVSYFLIEMGYPIAPLVFGVILGPMADENLRRAPMVSQGSFLPVFQRPVSLILFLIIVWTVISQFPWYQTLKNSMIDGLLRRKN
jgi:putative tricarboxylic transport membrane protein